MSKEERNNPISNSQSENESTDSTFNTRQIDQSDIIQESSESNQISNETDHKINSESSCKNQDSNFTSEDLKNVNKQGDSGCVNEKSALDIKESVNQNNISDQSLSQCNSELTVTDDTHFAESAAPSSAPNQLGEDVESVYDTGPKSETLTDTKNKENQENISESRKLDADTEDQITNAEEEKDIENKKKTVADLCTDSGPHFAQPGVSDTTRDEDSGEKDEIEVTESQSDTKLNKSEPDIGLPSESDFIKEQTKDTEIINNVSNEQECDAEVHGTETTTYEDDFEETKEDEQNSLTEESHLVNIDEKEHVNENKDSYIYENVKKDELNTDEVNEISQAVVPDTRLNEDVADKITDNSETHEQENSKTSVSVNEERDKKELTEVVIDEEGIPKVSADSINTDNIETHEPDDFNYSRSVNEEREEKELTEVIIDEDGIPKVSANSINTENIETHEQEDCNYSRIVNEEREEKELTEIIIDEDGIPKVAVTTVPDRPPSSLVSDSDKADLFEDFPSDTDYLDSKLTELNRTDDSQDTVETNKEESSDALKEEKNISDRGAMENSDDKINDKHDNKDEVKQDNGNLEETNTSSDHNDVSESVIKEKKSDEQFATEATSDPSTQEQIENKDEGKLEKSETEQRPEASVGNVESQKESSTVNDSMDDKNADKEKVQTKESTNVTETKERSKSPEPVSAPKQESPLEQMLRRNVTIDGTVESVAELESNVTALLVSMKDVMKYYSDLLKLQALKDFTNDLGKFKGDFTSINEAFKRCSSMSLNVNQHLKELRHVTEDVRAQFQRKFQQEDLSTWVDIPPEKEKEKERMQEEAIAAEKAAMFKAAEARHAVAKACIGVAEAQQLVAEMETQAADAEAISQKAAAQACSALIAAEEARVAAEERRRADEVAKKRAEERARIKAAEEEKKKAVEEIKIYQDAAAKGTSVEDERRTFMEEKKQKELERKNPKNWPRFSYKTEGIDFTPAVGCIIRAIEGSMRKTDVTCSFVDQSKGVLTLAKTEELVSNIIHVKQIEEERSFSFEEPLSIALPVCIGRIPSGKETVVKQRMPNGAWREIPSADVQFEDYRELKFVEGRCNKFGTYVVVLQPKKDTLQFQKKGSKLICTSDARISFTNKPGTFKQNINAILEVQTLDSNVIPDLKMRSPKECEDLHTASPFIKFSIPVKTFGKPMTVILPLPQIQTRQKRPATGITRETKSQDLRPATARPTATTEDDPAEEIYFLHRDDKSCWTVNKKMHLVQPKSKDTVTFEITQPYQRMILLRTKVGKSAGAVEKMATFLENITTQRNVKVIARQRNDDVADVMIACTSSNRAERTLKDLEERSFTEGPNPSPDIVLREGQQLYLKFRGNIECISENPSLSFIFNSNIRATREFKINEKEEFAQKSLPSFRGFVQVFTKALVPRPIPEGAPKKNVQPEMVEAEILLAELLVELPKPEAVPPKPLATAPLMLKEGPLTNGVLRYIAGMLGKEWKDVAAELGLKPMRIQAILRNHVNKATAETRFDMLVTWAKRVPKAVDKVQILHNALIACGRPDIAEEVRHRGQQFKQQRFMSARVSHLRQAFVKVAKTTAVFNRWKTFAKDIGVPDDEIKRIDESGGSGQEKCYTSLETWKDAAGEEATVTSLATYLKTAKQERLSRDVEALVAS